MAAEEGLLLQQCLELLHDAMAAVSCIQQGHLPSRAGQCAAVVMHCLLLWALIVGVGDAAGQVETGMVLARIFGSTQSPAETSRWCSAWQQKQQSGINQPIINHSGFESLQS